MLQGGQIPTLAGGLLATAKADTITDLVQTAAGPRIIAELIRRTSLKPPEKIGHQQPPAAAHQICRLRECHSQMERGRLLQWARHGLRSARLMPRYAIRHFGRDVGSITPIPICAFIRHQMERLMGVGRNRPAIRQSRTS